MKSLILRNFVPSGDALRRIVSGIETDTKRIEALRDHIEHIAWGHHAHGRLAVDRGYVGRPALLLCVCSNYKDGLKR